MKKRGMDKVRSRRKEQRTRLAEKKTTMAMEGNGIGLLIFFFEQKTAYAIFACLMGSGICIRDRHHACTVVYTQSVVYSNI